ncbi:chemotaxis protein, partial [Methylobacterium sp. J-030]|nr:chemotaxis protein [Methylobacterium sp. J-030]
NERARRAEIQKAVGDELDAIGGAASDVSRQTQEAAQSVGQVTQDIRSMATGSEQHSLSVNEIS